VFKIFIDHWYLWNALTNNWTVYRIIGLILISFYFSSFLSIVHHAADRFSADRAIQYAICGLSLTLSRHAACIAMNCPIQSGLFPTFPGNYVMNFRGP